MVWDQPPHSNLGGYMDFYSTYGKHFILYVRTPCIFFKFRRMNSKKEQNKKKPNKKAFMKVTSTGFKYNFYRITTWAIMLLEDFYTVIKIEYKIENFEDA